MMNSTFKKISYKAMRKMVIKNTNSRLMLSILRNYIDYIVLIPVKTLKQVLNKTWMDSRESKQGKRI